MEDFSTIRIQLVLVHGGERVAPTRMRRRTDKNDAGVVTKGWNSVASRAGPYMKTRLGEGSIIELQTSNEGSMHCAGLA